MDLKFRVLDSIRWLALAQLISQVLRIGVSIYVIRQLENEHMAYVALCDAIVSFLDMFSTLGLGAVIVSKKDLTEKDLANISGMLVLINLLLTVILVAASGFLARLYDTPEIEKILQVMAICFAFTAIASPPNSLLNRDMRFKEVSANQLVASIVGAATSLILVNLGYEYWSIVMGGFTYIMSRSIGVVYLNGGLVLPRFSIAESRQHINFGGFVMLSSVAWYLYKSMDVAIAGFYWSPELLGIYAVAIQLTVMPLNRIMPLLKSVALPAYSKTVAHDSTKLQDYISKSLRVTMTVCFPLYFGISAISNVLIPLLLGENWIASSLPLMCLCFATPFRFFLELLDPALIASGHPRRLFFNSSLISVVMIACYFLVSANFDSPVALALVWAGVFPIMSLIAGRDYCKTMNISYWSVVNPVFMPLLLSAAMWVSVRAFIEVSQPLLSPVAVVAFAIFVGIAVYGLLSLVFHKKVVLESYQLLVARKS